MREIREVIEEEFSNQDLSCSLTNQSDYKLGLKVSKLGFRTVLNIIRHTHNPLEVEVSVDYSLAKQKYVIRSYRPDRNGTGVFAGPYRWLWLLLIFSSILVSLVGFVIGIFEKITPELTMKERIYGIFSFLAIVSVFWIFIVPKIEKQRAKSLQNFDHQVLTIVVDRLKKLNEEITPVKLLRCWSCFEKIDPNDNVCIQCGVKQK